MKKHIELFLVFAKIGVMTFGGGMAMLPILEREIAETKRWASLDDLHDYYAIGQCTPGIIAVNTATFVGNTVAGFSGGIAATLGVVFPSLVIITTLAGVIAIYAEYPVVQNAFAGISAAVTVLVFNSLVKLSKSAVTDLLSGLVFLAVLAVAFLTDISPVVPVIASAIVGIAAKSFMRNREDGASVSETQQGEDENMKPQAEDEDMKPSEEDETGVPPVPEEDEI